MDVAGDRRRARCGQGVGVGLGARRGLRAPTSPSPGPQARANKLERAKAAEIEHFRQEGLAAIGELTDCEFLMAGLGLYARYGSKSDGSVVFSNSNPAVVAFFCAWFRRFFDVDETRPRVRLYLHTDLDLPAAQAFWSDLTGVPVDQFNRAYRAAADTTMRHNRHVHGCCHVRYNSASAHRRLMGLMEAAILVSSSRPFPG